MMYAKLSHSVVLGALAFSAILTLGGCTSVSPQPSETPVSGVKIFRGTPAEWTTLIRACLEDNGLKTADLPDGGPGGFMVSNVGVTQEQQDEITSKCHDEVGEPQMEGLSDEELHRRYDARVKQFACLVDEGLASGSPMSYETFVDDYNRSGQKKLWEPGAITTTIEKDGIQYGAANLCPLDPDSW